MTSGGKTWKQERDARLARERQQDKALNEAFDRREAVRLLSASMVRNANARSKAERQRVADLIRRDKVAKEREEARLAAEIDYREDGKSVSLTDSILSPTEEWFKQGDSEKFTPKQPDGTVREIATVRRVLTPIVARLHAADKITDDQFAACMWYRDRHEVAGLQGRFSTSKMSDMPSGGGVGFAGSMPATEREAIARHQYRAARDAITPFYLIFLDIVVLKDVTLRKAAPVAKCPQRKVEQRFRMVAQQLVDHCEAEKISLRDWHRGAR